MAAMSFLGRTLLFLALFLAIVSHALPTSDLDERQWDWGMFGEEAEEAEEAEIGEFGGITLPAAAPAAEAAPEAVAAGPRIYFLSQSKGAIISMGPNGESPKTILSGLRNGPDGIAVDKAAGYIYFTNMTPGSVHRVNLDGSNQKVIVPTGVFRVGKQLILVTEGGVKKLYWADREGMKVMRANVDGTGVEVVVDTSKVACTGSQCKYAVGVAVDTTNGYVYWTQKGAGMTGSIHRVKTTMPAGMTAATRTDIQSILQKLPEPIDLRWVDGFGLYWTDRGSGPTGNTVNVMPMTAEVQAGKAQFPAQGQILARGLAEGIGIAIDTVTSSMWFTDLGGNVYHSKLDGTGKKVIASRQGILTGTDYAA